MACSRSVARRGFKFVSRSRGIALLIGASAAIALLQSNSQSAQHAQAQPNDLDTRTRQALRLKNCELTSVRVQQALEDEHARLELEIDGEPCTVAIEPVAQQSQHYQLLVQTADGSLTPAQSQPVRTYRGHIVEHPDSEAALTMTNQGVVGAIRTANGTHWIEPLQGRVPGAPAALHAVYRGDDVEMIPASCGVDDQWLQAINRPMPAVNDPGQGDSAPPVLNAVGVCTAQLAIDCDFEYFQAYGSVAAVEARVNAIINAVNLQYESEVGIRHQISAIIIRTGEPDPYASFNPDTLLQQLRSHWNNQQGGIQRDVVQLFTGKNLNGSTIGLAYVGVVCDLPFAYSVVQSDFSASFACVTDLTAHELGHTWNAVHCACSSPPYTMNPSAACANTFHPTLTVPEITAYRNNISCLTCGPVFEGGSNLAGASAGDQFGRSIAFAGDINGDGEPEFIVGAPFNDENGLNAGKIQLHDGASSAVLWSRKGAAAGDRFGWSVAAVAGQVMVGAPFQDSRGPDAGRVYICDAVTGALVASRRGQRAGDHFGYSMKAGGDVNNDGEPDLIVGAPDHDSSGSNRGAVYIYRGSGWTLHKKLLGENAGDRFGFSVVFVGRANGDGHDDVAVGAPGNDDNATNAGKAYVYSGSTFSQVFAKVGEGTGDQFGNALAGPGRMNGDLRDDLVVAAPLANPGGRVDAGSVYAYSGSTGNLRWKRTGATAGDRFGWSIAPAGDPNGDARADVIIGSPRNDLGGLNAGRAFVVSGSTGLNLQVFTGEGSGDQFGMMVAGRGARGNPETARVLVGAPLNDFTAPNAGRVYRFQSAASMGSMIPGPGPCGCDVAGNDGAVDSADVLAIVEAMASCPQPCPPSCPADVNGDCVVDALDVSQALAAWGACE